MKRYSSFAELPPTRSEERVVTIGNFDGVHLGHRAVLRAAKEEAGRRGLSLAALTFEPHPAEVLIPDAPRLRLLETERKAELLAENGVDLALFQRFDPEFAGLSAKRFARDVLFEAMRARLVFVGRNFRFGRSREAGLNDLTALGDEIGFEVCGEPLVNAGSKEVSSSRIRAALAEGDVEAATAMLGRFHEVAGTVKRDRAVGAAIGFPTANLEDIRVVIPAPGIYAAYCFARGRRLKAAAYVGDRPTMGAGSAVEAHLIDFNGDLYGERIVLGFVKRIRNDAKFSNVLELSSKIAEDVQVARSVL